MALPATGDTISMTDINNYFVGGGFASSFTISVLGTYIGVTAGNTISMSSTFGGYYFPTPP
tara:strand:+ start:3552 stop:3734 length:183 start_codon:yes stop_codon:yes gene_type:complete